MSEQLVVSIPWGLNAVKDWATSPGQVEALLLQQSIIDGLQTEQKRSTAKYQAIQERCSDLEFQVSGANHQIQQLEIELEQANKALIERGEISSDELEELQATVSRLEALLEAAELSKQQAISRMHDQERATTAAQYQRDQTQQLFDSQRQGLIDLKKEHAAAVSERDSLSAELSDSQKYIARLEQEIAGVPTRIDNAVKTALAGQSELSHSEVTQLQQEVARLAQENQALTAQRDDLQTENQTLEAQAQELIDIANLGNESVDQAKALYEDISTKNNEYKAGAQKISELLSCMQQELASVRKDNITIASAVEYMQGSPIYRGEDGTMVFMLHNDLRPYLDFNRDQGCDEQTPHPDYPVCWVVRPDGIGHLTMLARGCENLTFPHVPDDVLMDMSHHDPLVKAIREKPTLPEQVEAFKKAIEYRGNVAIYAELLDFDFAQTRTASELMTAMINAGWGKEDVEHRRKAIDQFQRLDQRYRDKRTASEKRKASVASRPVRKTNRKKKKR